MEQRCNYYTPDAEEFGIGFEYEFRTGTDWEPLVWRADVTIAGRILKDLVRVKYLDKADIEDLGFEYENTDGFGYNTFSKNKETGFNTGANITIYHSDHNSVFNIYMEYYGSWGGNDSKFDVNVKNKSELKKLLKMLGIDGD